MFLKNIPQNDFKSIFAFLPSPNLITMGGTALSALFPVSDKQIALGEASWVKMLQLQLRELRLRAAARSPLWGEQLQSPHYPAENLLVSSSC